MSARTAADEKLDALRENLREAISNISDIVIHDCWGADRYNDETRENLEQILFQLIKMKRGLE